MSAKGRTSINISDYNNKIVAELLLERPYSCIEMAKKLKLTHTATGIISSRLLNMNLIRIHTDNLSKKPRGRQHVRYEINPSCAFFVCVNLQNGLESLFICDICGKVLKEERLSDAPVDELFVLDVINKIKEHVVELDLDINNLSVISIAIPGRIDNKKGTIIVSSKIKNEVNLRVEFAKAFPNAKIDIKNDIVYACTGSILSQEFDYEEGSHLFTYFGIGLGSCLVYNKRVVEGANGFSGEIGMNTISKDGKRLHDIFSYKMLLEEAKSILNVEELSLEELVERSKTVSELREKMLEIADTLGWLLRNIVDIAGCSHVVFSGEITLYPDYFFERLKETLTTSFYSDKITYKIDKSSIASASKGQIYLSRLMAIDWVMLQHKTIELSN